MTKRPLTHVYNRRGPDPDIYMTRVAHLQALMEERERQLIEARRIVDDRMQGYPQMFSTKEETRGEINGLKEILKRVEATVGELKEFQAKVSGETYGKSQMTGWLVALLVAGAGIGGMLFGTFVSPILTHFTGQ